MEQVEAIVIGAGVVGLAVARALALAGREVLVLEAGTAFGTGTSARNSGVIHAGIYYLQGSLKARACVRGKRLLYDYCRDRPIPHKRIGKLIVATTDAEVAVLEGYRASGMANGVDDLELLGTAELKEKEPAVHGVAALWSPSTGIIDAHALMLSLLGDLESAGGSLALSAPVTAIHPGTDRHRVHVGGAADMVLESPIVINAAGHGAPGLVSGPNTPKAHFAAGHYFSYSGAPPFSHLVYPVAEAGGLGIHATPDLAGQIRFGPDVDWRETLDYGFDESRKSDFVARIRRYFPELVEDRLQPDFVGVRPKISGQGEPAADFMILGPEAHGTPGLVHLLGIESPGLTSCLALAEEIMASLGLEETHQGA